MWLLYLFAPIYGFYHDTRFQNFSYPGSGVRHIVIRPLRQYPNS